MKKIFKICLILFIVIILTGCGKSDYKLIEMTANDLLTILTDEDRDDNFIFATINVRNNEEADDFKKLLRTYVKKNKTTIYYIDTSDLTFSDDEMLYSITNIDLAKQYVYMVKNNNLYSYIEYYKDMSLSDFLLRIHYKEIKMPTTDEDKKEHLEEAKKLYEEGYICSSYSELQLAWTLQSAKNYYKNHSYYYIINTWRTYVKEDNKVRSKELFIFNFEDKINEYNFYGKEKDYEYPSYNDYYDEDFYIKDDIIYIKEDDSKYKKGYEIISIEEDFLRVKDTNGIIYNMTPFSYDELNNSES